MRRDCGGEETMTRRDHGVEETLTGEDRGMWRPGDCGGDCGRQQIVWRGDCDKRRL